MTMPAPAKRGRGRPSRQFLNTVLGMERTRKDLILVEVVCLMCGRPGESGRRCVTCGGSIMTLGALPRS